MTLMAAATATWPRWVLRRPIYRERRKPMVRTRLRVGSFNACPMAIGVLESIGALSTSCRKQRLHLLPLVQGYATPSRSGTGGPTGADLTVADGKLHLDQRFASILDRRPARTDPALWTGDGLSLPIDGEVREIIAGLRLIEVESGGWDPPDPLHSQIDSQQDWR